MQIIRGEKRSGRGEEVPGLGKALEESEMDWRGQGGKKEERVRTLGADSAGNKQKRKKKTKKSKKEATWTKCRERLLFQGSRSCSSPTGLRHAICQSGDDSSRTSTNDFSLREDGGGSNGVRRVWGKEASSRPSARVIVVT